jgi:hypothetical protein
LSIPNGPILLRNEITLKIKVREKKTNKKKR